MEFAGGDANLYSYVMQDPINLVDFTGKGPTEALVAGIACEAALFLDDVSDLSDPVKIKDSIATLEHVLNQVNERLAESCLDERTRIELTNSRNRLLRQISLLVNTNVDPAASLRDAALHGVCLLVTGAAALIPAP